VHRNTSVHEFVMKSPAVIEHDQRLKLLCAVLMLPDLARKIQELPLRPVELSAARQIQDAHFVAHQRLHACLRATGHGPGAPIRIIAQHPFATLHCSSEPFGVTYLPASKII
jgi:hypothetical protein